LSAPFRPGSLFFPPTNNFSFFYSLSYFFRHCIHSNVAYDAFPPGPCVVDGICSFAPVVRSRRRPVPCRPIFSLTWLPTTAPTRFLPGAGSEKAPSARCSKNLYRRGGMILRAMAKQPTRREVKRKRRAREYATGVTWHAIPASPMMRSRLALHAPFPLHAMSPPSVRESVGSRRGDGRPFRSRAIWPCSA
jgi:hypothetical protein